VLSATTSVVRIEHDIVLTAAKRHALQFSTRVGHFRLPYGHAIGMRREGEGWRGEGRGGKGREGMGKGGIGPATFWLLPPPMHANQWVRLPVWMFLLVFCDSAAPRP